MRTCTHAHTHTHRHGHTHDRMRTRLHVHALAHTPTQTHTRAHAPARARTGLADVAAVVAVGDELGDGEVEGGRLVEPLRLVPDGRPHLRRPPVQQHA